MKEDKVGSDGNNKVQNPGEMLQGKSAPRSQSEEEEDQEELVVGRAMYCNKEKSEPDKDTEAGEWRYRHKETKRYSYCNTG